jgi:hypothetical protein
LMPFSTTSVCERLLASCAGESLWNAAEVMAPFYDRVTRPGANVRSAYSSDQLSSSPRIDGRLR